MARRFLPPDNSKELEELIKEYLASTRDQLPALAKRLGFRNDSSLMDSMRHRFGIGWAEPAREIAEAKEMVVNLPTVKLKTYKPIKHKGKGDPETQVLLLGDSHAGEITPTFNTKVLKARLNKLYNSLLTITYLHRNMYPVNDLVIIDLGDNVHGENVHQGATIENTECGAVNQVFDIALPEINNLLGSLSQEFKSIKFYGLRGNHGRYSLEAPRTSNWDMMLYHALKAEKLSSNIEVYPCKDFSEIVSIQGFKFFCFHGDQVRMYQGIPYFALLRKIMSWYITYNGFDYSCSGHCHKDDLLRVSAKTKHFINGAFPTDDPFALRVIGTSAIPSQWTFGVHKKYGVTWAYSLVLDEAFLPTPAGD